jgi:hypothetical protein
VADEIASPRIDRVAAEAVQQSGEFVPSDRRDAAGRAESGDWPHDEIDRGQGYAGNKTRP